MIRIHPAAELFPAMTDAEYASLREDIRANGLIEPLKLSKGLLLDGRNRARACEELGIEPKTEEVNGVSPIAYVIAANLHRRHLTLDQQSVLAAEALPHFQAEAKKRQEAAGKHGSKGGRGKTNPSPKTKGRVSHATEATSQAASAFGVSRARVETARKIQEKSPQTAEAVKAGTLTLKEARKKVMPSPGEAATKDPMVRWTGAVERLYILVGSLLEKQGGVKPFVKQWSKGDRRHFAEALDRLIRYLRQIRREL